MLAKRAGHKLAVGSTGADRVARIVRGERAAETVGHAAVASAPVGKVFEGTSLAGRGSDATKVGLAHSARAQGVAEQALRANLSAVGEGALQARQCAFGNAEGT